MGNRAEKNKEMPDEMCAFFLHRKGGDAYGIQQATGQDPDKERHIVGEHFRQEYQSAPAEDDIEGDMNLCGPFRTENSDQRNAGQYDRPLDDAEGHAQTAFLELGKRERKN